MFNSNGIHFKVFNWVILIMLSCTGIMFSTAHAGEATEVIEEALQAYKKQDLTETANALNEALAIVLQEKSAKMETKCPNALDGWKKDETSSNSAGAAFGGGSVTQCIYRNNDNNKVTITFTTDSPMLQSMSMMFNNPMFANSSGGKLKRIRADGKKHKTIIKYREKRKSGEITSVYENILVNVKGKASQEELISIFKSIKFSSLNAK